MLSLVELSVCSVVWVRTTQTHKKNYRHEHRGIMSSSAWFGFFPFVTYTTETRLLLDFSLKSELFWSVLKFSFLKIKVFKDKSVWSWKLAWMSALLCRLNFASSFIRNSHHQYVFFSLFFPFRSFKAGLPWFEFLVIFDFLHHRIDEVERHLLLKCYKKILRKSWSNMPPKLHACIRFLYEVVHKIRRLRKFNRSREIEFNF